MGAINLEMNSLFTRFSINQHLRVGRNIVQLRHQYQGSVFRLRGRQVLVENQDRPMDDLSRLVRSGTGWIGALAHTATCVAVVQITVNTSAPPGNEGLRASCPRNIPGRCREQQKKRAGPAVTGKHAEQADGDEPQHKADLTWVNSEVCRRLPAGLIFFLKKERNIV